LLPRIPVARAGIDVREAGEGHMTWDTRKGVKSGLVVEFLARTCWAYTEIMMRNRVLCDIHDLGGLQIEYSLVHIQ
jgi:hypothetical protein